MRRFLLPVLLLFSFTSLTVKADDWAQWRGPDRTGVSKETGLLKSWPKGGPKLIWEAKGAGSGYASVVISKGKVFTLGDGPSTANNKEEYVSCFDDKDGKQLWKTKLGHVWTDRNNADRSGAPASTPTIDGGFLFVITPHGVLSCLETGSGKEKWSKDLKKEFGGDKGDGWGYSESPLIDGDRLICTPGKEKNTMVALDRNSGDTIWTASSKGDKGAGHSSIVISEVGGTKVYVQTTASGALGVRAKDGKLLWTYGIERTTAVIPTPIVRGDLVFFSAGYNRGGALLRQKASGDDVKVEEVYGLKIPLNNKHGGIILIGDYLYGDTNDGGFPFCADLLTGKLKWKRAREAGTGKGSASLTAADGRLYIHYTDGTMALVEANSEKFKETGSFKIPGSGSKPGWAHPVVCNGRLYLREQDRILCYDIKQGASSKP